MSILTDRSLLRAIRERELEVSGLTGDETPGGVVQPSSIDLHLGDELLGFPRMETGDVIDPESPPEMEPRGWKVDDAGREFYPLQYGEMVLGATLERIRVGRNLAAQVDGKSTLGRLGLFVHITAGFIDPGWCSGESAPITLELLNMAPGPFILRPRMAISQLVVFRATTASALGYGHRRLTSHYADSGRSAGPIGARSGSPRGATEAVDLACTGTRVGEARILGCGNPSCLIHGDWRRSPDGIGLGEPRMRA